MKRMLLFVKMAARNIRKYWRRSAQSGAAIFLGVFFVALAGSFMAGFGSQVTQDFITTGGHLVARSPGYAERRAMMPLNRLIPGAESARRALGSAVPRVSAFASLYAPGVVSRGGKTEVEAPDAELLSKPVVCAGIMPYSGGAANPAFQSARERVIAGRFFAETGESGAVLSDKMAQRIGAAPGNNVIFLCSDKYGSFSLIELPLLGVFSADEYSEQYSCLFDLASLQAVTGAEGEAAEIAAYVMDGEGRPQEPRQAAAAVRAMEIRALQLGLAPERWDAASSAVASMLEFMDVFMVITYVLFAVVAGVGIMNSILLSMQDRIRDFGTLRAIAFTGGGVCAIIAVEALLLGALASLLGTLAAWGASAYFQVHGIPLTRIMAGVATVFPRELHTVTEPPRLLASLAAGTLMPVLAALYPMSLLRRMSIREALGFA